MHRHSCMYIFIVKRKRHNLCWFCNPLLFLLLLFLAVLCFIQYVCVQRTENWAVENSLEHLSHFVFNTSIHQTAGPYYVFWGWGLGWQCHLDILMPK